MRQEINEWLVAQPAIMDWLEAHYQGREKYQTGRGIRFALKFSEYVNLWGIKKLKQVTKLIESGRIGNRMRHPEKGWVLSWISREAREAGEMNCATARILQRNSSKHRFYLKAGDTHTDDAKRRIGDAKRESPSRRRISRPSERRVLAYRKVRNTKPNVLRLFEPRSSGSASCVRCRQPQQRWLHRFMSGDGGVPLRSQVKRG